VTPRAVLRLAVLVTLALPGLAAAQGLGDTAAREREKRAKEQKEQKEKPAPVFTNDDLDAGRPPGEERDETGSSSSGSESSSDSESSGSSSREGPPPLPDRLAADRPWIDAVKQAQAEVASIEDQIRQANGRLNPMSTDYIYGPSGSNDANEELRVRQELTELQARLVEAREAVAAANAELRNHREGRPASSSEE